MGKKLPNTPSSRIRSALHLLWMRSRERQNAVKIASNTCRGCGGKGRPKETKNGPKLTIEVHHWRKQPDWERIFAIVREELLQTPEDYVCLCKKCHKDEHLRLTK